MTRLSSENPELFKGRHFNHLLIIQAVRWYVTYKLSYRDVCDLMAERGVTVVHTTVLRRVQCFVPVFEKMWKKYARPVGSSWRVDETYIKVKQRRYPMLWFKTFGNAEVTLSGIARPTGTGARWFGSGANLECMDNHQHDPISF